jgi:hypothetical protein
MKGYRAESYKVQFPLYIPFHIKPEQNSEKISIGKATFSMDTNHTRLAKATITWIFGSQMGQEFFTTLQHIFMNPCKTTGKVYLRAAFPQCFWPK